MSTPTIIKYPLDVLGTAPTNLIVGEELSVPRGSNSRAFALKAGPFFANSVILTHAATGVPLTPGVDYKILYLHEEATQRVGQPIMSVVWVFNTEIYGNLLAQYQVLGGDFTSNVSVIAMLIETLQLDNRAVEWDDVLYKPVYYPPAPHLHHVRDWYGFDDIIEALDRISAALGAGGGNVDLSAIYLRLDQIDVDMLEQSEAISQLSSSMVTALNAIQTLLNKVNTANIIRTPTNLVVGQLNLFMTSALGTLPTTVGLALGSKVEMARRQVDIRPEVQVFDRNVETIRYKYVAGPDFTYATLKRITATLVEPGIWEITL